MPTTHPTASRTTNGLLWVLQVLLAGLFLFAGGFKLVAPIAERNCHAERNRHAERSEGSSPQDRTSAASVGISGLDPSLRSG